MFPTRNIVWPTFQSKLLDFMSNQLVCRILFQTHCSVSRQVIIFQLKCASNLHLIIFAFNFLRFRMRLYSFDNVNILSIDSGMFQSPDYPNNYVTNMNVCWLITGQSDVLILFSYFWTKPAHDFVRIWDGESISSPCLPQVSGGIYQGDYRYSPVSSTNLKCSSSLIQILVT